MNKNKYVATKATYYQNQPHPFLLKIQVKKTISRKNRIYWLTAKISAREIIINYLSRKINPQEILPNLQS